MIRVISLTEAGRRLGDKIKSLLTACVDNEKNTMIVECHHKPKPFSETVQRYFNQGDRLILICATGIAIRTLAPVIKSKLTDPPVLVLDELGKFVVPLLSGHEGGANQWADELANQLSAIAVITTAKPYLNPVYTLGMGCERNCPEEYLTALRDLCLQKAELKLTDIHSLHSIDIKSDELGLMRLAKNMGVPFNTWDSNTLSTVEHLLSTKSDYVYQTVGVYGVAESAALIGANQVTGDVAELILFKHKNAKATCAIAKSYPLADENHCSSLEDLLKVNQTS